MLFNVTVQRNNGILETYRNVDGEKVNYQTKLSDFGVEGGKSSFAGFPIVSVEKVTQEQINAELSYFNKFGTGCE
jgi:hypothetical protein